MLDNDHMNQDPRNLGLVGATDGVPLFDDQHRGAWPFIQRVAMTDQMSMNVSNAHLHLLTANEYWELDKKVCSCGTSAFHPPSLHLRYHPQANCLRRVVRGPKSLKPHLMVLADDMRKAYYEGVTVTDSTYPEGAPGRVFKCRVVQLLWSGDFPALSKVGGSHEKCCHWCHFKSKHSPEINRRVWGDFRSWLPEHHEYRTATAFGPPCRDPAPAYRTHEEYEKAALAQEAYVRQRNPDTGKPLPKVLLPTSCIT